jgi:predicted transcriptional regulator
MINKIPKENSRAVMTIKCSADLKRRLTEVAESREGSLSALVKGILVDWLKKNESKSE